MKPNMFEVEIDITEDDINHGIRCSSNNCPAAYALDRAVPNNEWHGVAGSYADIRVDGKEYRSMRSKELNSFTIRYDGYFSRFDAVPTKIKLTFVERDND